MRITITETVQHGAQALCAGVQCDVSDDQAQAWIQAGQALSDEPEPIPALAPEQQPEQQPEQADAPVKPAKTGKAK